MKLSKRIIEHNFFAMWKKKFGWLCEWILLENFNEWKLKTAQKAFLRNLTLFHVTWVTYVTLKCPTLQTPNQTRAQINTQNIDFLWKIRQSRQQKKKIEENYLQKKKTIKKVIK